MKKFKTFLIVVILFGITYYYREDIGKFIEALPFFNSEEETEPEFITDKSSYEYYFEPFITEKG